MAMSDEHVAKVSESFQSKSKIGAACNKKAFTTAPVHPHGTVKVTVELVRVQIRV